MWKRVWIFTYAACEATSEINEPYRRLNNAGRMPWFSVRDQDVNNVLPSKQTRSSRWGRIIFPISSNRKNFLQLTHVNANLKGKIALIAFSVAKLTQRIAFYWGLIIGNQGEKWKKQREHSWGQLLDNAPLSFLKDLFCKAGRQWVIYNLQ